MVRCNSILIIFFFLMTSISVITLRVASAQELQRSIITDPSVSRRCKILLKKRRQKIVHKQKVEALILRNTKLQKYAPKNRISVKKKLSRNQLRLKHELRLVKQKIDRLSEDAIKKGCPGIIL